MNNKNLYFFTATYPYNTRESFIETEIKFLSEAFDNITIIPLTGSGSSFRKVPSNCKVLSPIIRNRWQKYSLGLFGLKTIKIFGMDFFKRKVYLNKNRLKTFISSYCITNLLLQSKVLKKVLNEIQKEDVMYFYWGKGLSFIPPFLNKNNSKKVIRFHGEWDLWEESSGDYAPIRNEVISSIDIAAFISKTGQSYFKQKYPFSSVKTIVSYLGTIDHGIAKRSNDGIFRLLSCSNVISIKRVNLIFESLQLLDRNIVEWTHIGDGIEFEKLKILVKTSRSNVKVKLLGNLSNVEVFSYYKENMIDAFINVSSIEGLPVSLMEAISFDIPIIGTNVGGCSEIINSETGILLSENPSKLEVADSLIKIQQYSFSPKSFWEKNFNANNNYINFIRNIN